MITVACSWPVVVPYEERGCPTASHAYTAVTGVHTLCYDVTGHSD